MSQIPGDNIEPEDLSHTTPINPTDASFEIVAMAASAGGLAVLIYILSCLPASFPAAIVIVQHLDPHHRSLMAEILNRRSHMHVKEAEEGDVLASGTVYVAPPDRHLLVIPDGSLTLTQTELVHFLRPSADLLFESVAASFKQRAIAVVLSGTGSDGAMGVHAIKKMGGKVIVQDETTAEFYGMPSAAIQTGVVDSILPMDEIPPKLISMVMPGNSEDCND